MFLALKKNTLKLTTKWCPLVHKKACGIKLCKHAVTMILNFDDLSLVSFRPAVQNLLTTLYILNFVIRNDCTF